MTYYYVERRGERGSGQDAVVRTQGYPQHQQQGAAPALAPARGYGTVAPAPAAGGSASASAAAEVEGEGGVPPSYEQAVLGDNKVQR